MVTLPHTRQTKAQKRQPREDDKSDGDGEGLRIWFLTTGCTGKEAFPAADRPGPCKGQPQGQPAALATAGQARCGQSSGNCPVFSQQQLCLRPDS